MIFLMFLLNRKDSRKEWQLRQPRFQVEVSGNEVDNNVSIIINILLYFCGVLSFKI